MSKFLISSKLVFIQKFPGCALLVEARRFVFLRSLRRNGIIKEGFVSPSSLFWSDGSNVFYSWHSSCKPRLVHKETQSHSLFSTIPITETLRSPKITLTANPNDSNPLTSPPITTTQRRFSTAMQ